MAKLARQCLCGSTDLYESSFDCEFEHPDTKIQKRVFGVPITYCRTCQNLYVSSAVRVALEVVGFDLMFAIESDHVIWERSMWA